MTPEQERFVAEYLSAPHLQSAEMASGYTLKPFEKPDDFYVYILADPFESEAIYVGKGKGKRALQHQIDFKNGCLKNTILANRLSELAVWKRDASVLVFAEGLPEQEAYAMERKLIQAWKGWLTNIGGGQKSQLERDRAWAEKMLRGTLPFHIWCLLYQPDEYRQQLYWEWIEAVEQIRDGVPHRQIDVGKDGELIFS